MSFIIQPIIHVKLIRIGVATSHHRAAAAANKKFVAPATRNSNNEIWVVIIAIVLTFVLSETVAAAQKPKKVPRIGYLAESIQLLILLVPRQFGRLCASVAT
jgi:hypothetical protein